MRCSLCPFCKKHKPTAFDPDSIITCYDDCCIGGNRFEPEDIEIDLGNGPDNKSEISKLKNALYLIGSLYAAFMWGSIFLKSIIICH